MIRIAVYDDNKANIEKMDRVFSYHAVNRNTEYDVSWFVGEEGLKRIEKYATGLHIALISIHAKESRQFSRRLYQKNSGCRICYFDASKTSFVDISNPLWFLDEPAALPADREELADKIDQLFNGFKYFGNLLIFDTRQLLYIIPIEEVLYLRSDLKYVNIVYRDGNSVSVYKKLDEVEKSLSDVFLRIHKSYIVNKTCIDKLDKANHTVILTNREELPISGSQYPKVLEELSLKV